MGRWVIYGTIDNRVTKAVDKLAAVMGGRTWLAPGETDCIQEWVHIGLLQCADDKLVNGPNALFLSAEFAEGIKPIVDDYVKSYVRLLEKECKKKLQVAAVQFFNHSWEELEHIFVTGMLIDLGVGQAAKKLKLIARPPASFWVWKLPANMATSNSFGVRMCTTDSVAVGAAQIWHQNIKAPKLCLDSGDIECISELLHNGGLSWTDPRLLRLKYWRLVARNNGLAVPKAPVFRCQDGNPVWDLLAELANLIATEILVPLFACVDKRVLEFNMPILPARHIIMRLLLEQVVDAAISSGVLSPFPKLTCPQWGVWLWTEDPELCQLSGKKIYRGDACG